ncbi:MAG: MerR family transcriptional regulator [Armatimonadetes bacterium]|nr:MerR family transcriptional regulator [Armatimonadota bacterium]
MLSLEELCGEVTRRLGQLGLTQSDNRVSAAPDARTVRYYTTLGLIDRPTVQGRQARYGERHVLQLLAVKALQGMSLPLADVQARLYGKSDQELEALLGGLRPMRRDTPPVVVRWQEVTIEPGLKILVDERWAPGEDLNDKIRAALAALSQNGNSVLQNAGNRPRSRP